MIACAQCGKKNKDNATVCKYCGYNPSAFQINTMSWGYQNGAYTPVQYQPPMPQGGQYYYDANGKAYNVRYDYKVTPVEEMDEDDEDDAQQMMLYPYNPTLGQPSMPQQAQMLPTAPYMQGQMPQQAPSMPYMQEPKPKNLMAWIGYILALFIDIFAWPVCFLGLAIASRRDGARKDLCIGGMLFTLLRVLSAGILFLLWWGISTYLPEFFASAEEWKLAVAKIIMFGWPVAIGSIFAELSAEDSAGRAAGKGFFYFSLAVAILGILFFDVSWLHLFA